MGAAVVVTSGGILPPDAPVPSIMLPVDHEVRIARARLALDGLSLGDAFGERFFVHPATVDALIDQRTLSGAPVWHWTDDTAMAVSIVAELAGDGAIDRDRLARRFADACAHDPARGYGARAHGILTNIAQGIPWHIAATSAFGGLGSMGNGSAMRVAPVGAYFADDLARVTREAAASSQPTHAHPDGSAGAIAVAVAAALASSTGLAGDALLEAVLARTPDGPTRDGIATACSLAHIRSARNAAAILGSGEQTLCSDTVPFALWCASRHMADYEEALWATVSGLGDRDTTCAIVGGIVALRVGPNGLPAAWIAKREPMPAT